MIISVNLGIEQCILSCMIDAHPVVVARIDYGSLSNDGNSSFEKLAIEASPLDTYNLNSQSEKQITTILEWAFLISSKSFSGDNELTALLSLPIGMASAAKSTITYLAIKSGFVEAWAQHSSASNAAISLYSHISKGSCLAIHVDRDEVSGCLLDIDDGVFEVLGHEFCLSKGSNTFFADIASICTSFFKRVTSGESMFGTSIDYVLLSGLISDNQADEVKNLISSILKVSASSIYFSRDAAAIGGAICAGVLEGKTRDFLFMDCTTHSILIYNDTDGVAYELDQYTKQGKRLPVTLLMITRGVTTPTKKSEYILLEHPKYANLSIYDCSHEKIQSATRNPSLLYQCEAIQSCSVPSEALGSSVRIEVTVDIDAGSIASLTLGHEMIN